MALTPEKLHAYERSALNFLTGAPRTQEYLSLIDSRDRNLEVRKPEEMKRVIGFLNSNHHFTIGGMTGSGKSTQIPQLLLWDNIERRVDGAVLIVVPRKMAAKGMVNRIRAELGVTQHDSQVLLRMRGGESWSKKAKIVVATEGMCLNEILADPSMSKYSAVLFDEVHEKSSNLEVLFGWAEWVKRHNINNNIRFGFLSATLDFSHIASFMHINLHHHYSFPALRFPIQYRYADRPVANYVQWARAEVEWFIQSHDGDIIIFAPGSKECEHIASAVREIGGLDVYTVFADAAEEKKDRATNLRPIGSPRRVVVGTNILETSVTVPGVTFVIDTMIHKAAGHDPKLAHRYLLACPVSAAQADQRAGRTGRTGAGWVSRAVTIEYWNELRQYRPYPSPRDGMEEYASSLLSNLAAMDKAKSVMDTGEKMFRIPNPPAPIYRIRALDTLRSLAAITMNEPEGINITDIGRQLAFLSVGLELGRALIASVELGVLGEMIDLVSANDTSQPFLRSKEELEDFSRYKENQSTLSMVQGEPITLFNCFRAWRLNNRDPKFAVEHGMRFGVCQEAAILAGVLSGQMSQLFPNAVRNDDSVQPDIAKMVRSLCYGYTNNVAVKAEVSTAEYTFYRWRDDLHCLREATVSEEKALNYRYLIYHEARLDTSSDTVSIMERVTPVKREWLLEAAKSIGNTE